MTALLRGRSEASQIPDGKAQRPFLSLGPFQRGNSQNSSMTKEHLSVQKKERNYFLSDLPHSLKASSDRTSCAQIRSCQHRFSIVTLERAKTLAADVAELLIKPGFAHCLLKYSWVNNGGGGKTINENIFLKCFSSAAQWSFLM